MEHVRSFIAIEIPECIREDLSRLRNRWRQPSQNIRWIRAQNIHLTLKFLGDVPVAKVDAIVRKLQALCEETDAFHYNLTRLGVFPNPGKARLLWVGAESFREQLTQLAKKIDQALINLGFSKEKRKFVPHVTLGRAKSPLPRDFVNSFLATPFARDEVEAREIIMMRSDLRPTGAVYTAIKRIALRSL